jgi:hypothetical protein
MFIGRKEPPFLALALLCVCMSGGGMSGCSSAVPEDDDLPDGTAGTPDAEDSGATSIEFELGGELILRAGQTASLRVLVQPPGQYTVRFALLGARSDAFLVEDVLETDGEGKAEASLTALAASASFAVRAASGKVDKMLRVVTLEASEGNLIITPRYSGRRATPAWTASVHVNQTCASLQGIPFPDGSIEQTASGESVRLDAIPADVPLAAVIRAEQYVGGCRSIPALRASTDTFIDIDVMERPMQIADLALEMAFGVEQTQMPNPALDELAFRAVLPLSLPANDDLAALLDAMSVLAEDTAAFEQARSARDWRGRLVTSLGVPMANAGLKSMIQGWMRTGLRRLSEPDALQGRLSAVGPEGEALLELTEVIGLSPAEAGFQVETTASALAETEDFLRIGATLDWRPSPLLSAAANLTALAEDPERTSAADAMAEQFGCAGLAALLVDAGTVPDEAFAGCGEGCVLALCRGAMVQLWSRVAESDLPSVPWQISAASRAQVDQNARLTGVAGNWIGSLTLSDFGTTAIQGPYSGASL